MNAVSRDSLKASLADGSDAVLVDVREPHEYAEHHIEGSQNWPLKSVGDEILAYPPATEIVFICKTGKRSAQACSFVRLIGYTHAHNLTGGLAEWLE